jgi:hypothetical protein
MSLVYSASLSFLVPGLVFLLFKKQFGFLQILMFGCLALYFWRGSFFYPLTDLPSFLLLVLGVYIVVKFHQSWWTPIFAGVCWGGAALFRPSYQIVLVPLVLWMLYYFVGEMRTKLASIPARLGFLFAGMALVFAPQVAINLANYEILSPFVQTQVFFGGNDLFALQLGLGIDGQKYETNVGPAYPEPGVIFLDRQGQDVLVRSGYKSLPYNPSSPRGPDQPLTLTEYLKLVIKNPMDFAIIYFRHLFNGLDIVYDSVYVKNVYDRAWVLRAINYSLWFLVIAYAAAKVNLRGLRHLDSRFFVPAIYALPALISIPSSMEVRFLLPFHFMAYALVSFWIVPEFFALSPETRKSLFLRYFFWYLCFLLVCFTISENTYMGLQYGPNDSGPQ